MPHFLISKNEIKQNYIELSNDDNFFHIVKVLRAKVGEIIKFIDNEQNVFEAKITKISKNFLKAQITNTYKTDRMLSQRIVLIQSVLMNDAQNLAIANATQTGIKEIYPIISDNTSPPLSSLEKKVEKWGKIALENFKQCERADLPIIHEISKLKETLEKFKAENILIFAEKYENCNLNNCLNDISKNDDIAIVIGPEGGFSEDEFEYFKAKNLKLITMGKMIYKAPNAITASVSNIISRLENNV